MQRISAIMMAVLAPTVCSLDGLAVEPMATGYGQATSPMVGGFDMFLFYLFN